MQCAKCEYENAQDLQLCARCGESLPVAPASPIPEPVMEYAGFGVRGMALVCDMAVGFALFLVPLITIIVVASPIDLELWVWLLLWVVFILYMIVAQLAFHTTVGKRLFGLQIRSASKARIYPDVLQLLVRESGGKFLSSCWMGWGFAAATYDPLHMTWADRISGTVVVRALPVSKTMKVVRVALIALVVLVVFVVVVMVMGP